MANINITRSAEINYTARAGDSFSPPPVSFTIDTVPEDFSGCTLKMQIRGGRQLLKEITETDGIGVSGNSLQYSISAADMANIPANTYKYEVQKTGPGGIVTTIQHGKIILLEQITT